MRQDDKQRIARIQADTASTEAEAQEFDAAVYGYSDAWAYEIRAVQSKQKCKMRQGHTEEEAAQKGAALETFIKRSPKWAGGETYRGMVLSKKDLDNLRTELKAGRGDMLGTSSWSTDKETGISFAKKKKSWGKPSAQFGDTKDIPVVLWSRSQTKATSIQHLSEWPGQSEVIASKECRYKYVAEELKDGYLWIEVSPIYAANSRG